MKTDLKLVATFTLAWAIIAPSNAATINVNRTEVGVGLEYLIGYGPVIVEDATTGMTDGLQPAVIQLGGATEGFYPNVPTPQFNSVGVDSRAAASIAYDISPGTAPSIFGTSSASMSFKNLVNLGKGIVSAPAHQNYVFMEFEVLDERVDYSISFDNSAGGYLRMRTLAGDTVLNLFAGGTHLDFLDPGIYTIHTYLSLAITSAGGTRSGNNAFAITFEDSVLNAPQVPLPAAAWLFASGLAVVGYSGWRRKSG